MTGPNPRQPGAEQAGGEAAVDGARPAPAVNTATPGSFMPSTTPLVELQLGDQAESMASMIAISAASP